MQKKKFLLAAALIFALVFPASSAGPEAKATPELTRITLGMGYIPNVQFAPLYVAQEKGYFAAEGLEVEFKYGMEDDLIKLVGTDQLQFAIGSGDQVILARQQGIPAVYVLTWYRRFPVCVLSLKEKGIQKPKDLEGKKVGIPGLFGASYMAWKALVYAAGLDEEKVELKSIGFTQAAAVKTAIVDAALDYIVSGPVQLSLAGEEIEVIRIFDYINLPSNGLITNDKTLAEKPELVEGMVRAILQGIWDTLKDPVEAFEIALRYVPEAGGENRKASWAVLEASLELWKVENLEELGLSDAQTWERAQAFMHEAGMIEAEVDVEELFTNHFVEFWLAERES